MVEEDIVLLSLISKARLEIKETIDEKIAEIKEEIDDELDEIYRKYITIKHFEKNNKEKEDIEK